MWVGLRAAVTLTMLGCATSPAVSDPVPSAFVTVLDLKGLDRGEGTAIRRSGKGVRAQLLMPLYGGDEIFLREDGSRIVITTETDTEETITGPGAHFEVKAADGGGSGFWSMLGAVSDALAGADGELAPDNMMTRDTDEAITIPMAVRGTNHIARDGKPVWLAWRGGKAPYRLSFVLGGKVSAREGVSGHEASIELPPNAPDRLRITIEDSVGRRASIKLRLHTVRPAPNFGNAASSAGGTPKHLIYAAWLTSHDEGRWSLEAARMLRNTADAPSMLLYERITTGWRATQPTGAP